VIGGSHDGVGRSHIGVDEVYTGVCGRAVETHVGGGKARGEAHGERRLWPSSEVCDVAHCCLPPGTVVVGPT